MSHPSPVALITGAGSGIGRACAIQLGEEGYRLVLLGRTLSKLKNTVDCLITKQPAAPDTMIVVADVADEEQARSAVDQTLQRWGRLDVLINNAAVASMQSITDGDHDLLQDTFATNVFGPIYLISHVWAAFMAQRSGCVINISSMAVTDPLSGLSVYAATKCALDSLTRSIVVEGDECNIRAYSIAPGAVETAMLRSIVGVDILPAEQTLDPQQIAEIVNDCIQGRRASENGQVIFVPSP